ncbi:LOW QUALITY PROTEIN: TBC1 domain family member 25 [Eudromia elegans]
MADAGGGAWTGGGAALEEECEVVRVRVEKTEASLPPEFRSFAVDPHITSLDVLQHILARAFDLQGKSFALSFAARDPRGGAEALAPLATERDLAAAFASAARPALRLRLDVRPPPEHSPLLEDWDIISPREAAAAPPPERRSLLAAALPLTQALLAQVGRTLARAQAALSWSEGPSSSSSSSSPPSAPSPPSPPPLGDADLRRYLGPDGRLVRPEALRLHVYHGGVEPGLRKVVWRYLLNIFPAGLTGQERLRHLRAQAGAYGRLKAALAARAAPGERALLAAAVREDVVRTDRGHPYFGGPAEGHPRLAALAALLTTFALAHPRLSYCQGMSEVAAPLLAVLDDEAQAYVCFCALMRRLAPRFRPGGRGLARAFAHLRRLLRRADPPLWAFLRARGAHDLLFCYRWLLLELKREFPFEDALRLLEVSWSSLPPPPPPPPHGVPLLGAPLGARRARRDLRHRRGMRPREPRRRPHGPHEEAGSLQEDAGKPGNLQEDTGRARNLQEEPRSLQEETRSPGGLHKESRSLQEEPKSPRSLQEEPRSPLNLQEGPKSLQAGPQNDKNLQEDPGRSRKLQEGLGQEPGVPEAVGREPDVSKDLGQDPGAFEDLGRDVTVPRAVAEDPNVSVAGEEDPKVSRKVGQDPDTLKTIGQDPNPSKTIGQDPNTPKAVDEEPNTVGQDPNVSKTVGQDPNMSKTFNKDPNTSKTLNEDPNVSRALDQDPTAVDQDPNSPKALGQDFNVSKTVGQDLKTSKTVDEDPTTSKTLNEDPTMSKTVGQDPTTSKTLNEDPTMSKTVGQGPNTSKALDQGPNTSKTLNEDPTASKVLDQDLNSLKTLDDDPPTSKALDEDPDSSLPEDPWSGAWPWEPSSSSSSSSDDDDDDEEEAAELALEDDGAPLPPPHELGQGNPFVLFVCVAMLQEQRAALLAAGAAAAYDDVAAHFDRLVRRHPLRRVLPRAKALFARYLRAWGGGCPIAEGAAP